ncbi:MAG: asparagine synthase (glutamine-hydrolyzing) [Gammaproteobacteria bacterium]|nr:asparagine synthase (glutamine-hydrolyzing) [Gammaproteobacteria bacterium]
MCGIAGLVSENCSPENPVLQRMLDALNLRGPDDEGSYYADGAALGQRRLSIIDLEGGHQPIGNEDGTVWIVCNGEIYNYKELREELIARNHAFSTHSDTEVILHLYEDMGYRCVDRLRGMFAFAIWDTRKQTLFAARDRLGQKPLYYSARNGELLLASEIKALLAADPSLSEMDAASLDQYLALRIIASPRSMFSGIQKLPPAHYMTFSRKAGLEISRYWDLDYEPKFTGTEEQILDELEEVLIEALKLHMVSDVPVGAFLSGGMDSTLVVSMLMRHVIKEPIQTFTIGLPYGKYNEAPAARLVAEEYGTIHHEEVQTPSLLATLPDLVWHLDEPSDPLSVCTFLIARMARKHVKVALGGDGGDELFGGYDRYYGNKYAGYYAMIPAFIRRYGIGAVLNRLPDGGWYKSKAHQIKWLHALSFLSGSKRYSRSLGYFYFGPEWRDKLYGEKMTRAVNGFEPEEVIWSFFDSAKARNPIDRMLSVDSFIRLPDHPVMISDRMTMANSLEVRSPLMDHKVAEFAARIPVDLKVRGRTLRYIQRRLLQRYLPKDVLERPKQGFSSALPYMLAAEYKKLFNIFLKESHLAREGYFRQDAINELLLQHLSGKRDNGNRLWLLLSSEVWYRMHIQGHGREELHHIINSH